MEENKQGRNEAPKFAPFSDSERVAVFIDGSNVYGTSRNLAFDIDYRNLHQFFQQQCNLVRIYYYAAVLETEEYSPLKPLTDWLAYNGYFLVTKAAKEFTDQQGRRRVKGSMEVEIACDMLELAEHIDHAVLFSGDADFRRLVEAMQRKGVRVTIVSSLKTTPPMVADELRRQCDQFWDLADIAQYFTRRRDDPVRPAEVAPVGASSVGGAAVVLQDRRSAVAGVRPMARRSI